MRNASQYAKRLSHLLSRLRKQVTPSPPPERTILEQLIHAFLTWNASRRQADHALSDLVKATVDLNELRVSDPEELIEIVGQTYPLAEQRFLKLKSVLNSVYRREHAMALEPLASKSKRDARAYLDELEGMVPYVSAAVVLLNLEGHAIPVDDNLRKRLVDDSVVEPYATLEEIQSFIEHHVKSDQGIATHQLLRAYVEKPIKVQIPGPIPKVGPAPAPPPPPKPVPAPVPIAMRPPGSPPVPGSKPSNGKPAGKPITIVKPKAPAAPAKPAAAPAKPAPKPAAKKPAPAKSNAKKPSKPKGKPARAKR